MLEFNCEKSNCIFEKKQVLGKTINFLSVSAPYTTVAKRSEKALERFSERHSK